MEFGLIQDTFLNLRLGDSEQLFLWVGMGLIVKNITTYFSTASIAWTACAVLGGLKNY